MSAGLGDGGNCHPRDNIALSWLAKELKLTSKELIDKFKVLKVSAKSHMSVLSADEVKLVKESMKKPAALKKQPAVTPPVPPKTENRPSQSSLIESAKKVATVSYKYNRRQ